MGRVTVADAARGEGVEEVRILDLDRDAAAALAASVGGPARDAPIDGADHGALVAALRDADAVVNATTHRLNVPVMRACLEVGAHYTDLGGLYWWALDQLELEADFRAAGLTAAISLGAAPGITNMLAAAACERLETVESIEVIDAVVPGRAFDPAEPYVPPYAPDTLIDEFTRPGAAVHRRRDRRDAGRRRREGLPPARGRRGVRLHDPLRARHAAGGLRRQGRALGRVAARPAAATCSAALLRRGRPGLDRSRQRRRRERDPARRPDRGAGPPARRRGRPGCEGAPARARRRHGGRRAGRDRRRPARWCSTRSGAPTRARTRRACRPRSRRRSWRAARRCGTGVGGAESTIPVATFFSELARRGMHAEITERRPLG